MKKILFVCTGNICRSPLAEAIARHKARILNKNIIFDSAGITAYHVGEGPDERMVEIANEDGIDFKGIKARKIEKHDFKNFDLIFAMDHIHYYALCNQAGEQNKEKIKLFLEYCKTANFWNDEMLDPYYKGRDAFKNVFKLTSEAVDSLIEMI